MKKQGVALVERQYLFPFVLITSLFFLWGFAHAILDVLNKHFQELLTITRTHSAMIQATMYMGYFIMAIPAGLFINRYGYRRGWCWDCCCMASVPCCSFPGSTGCRSISFSFPCSSSDAD